MLVAGDHAVNDMAGEGDSFVNVLKENGFETVAVLKGLGEYPLFRKIFTDKLKEMIG
jgi:sirohydrochlorin cobaltochelatase